MRKELAIPFRFPSLSLYLSFPETQQTEDAKQIQVMQSSSGAIFSKSDVPKCSPNSRGARRGIIEPAKRTEGLRRVGVSHFAIKRDHPSRVNPGVPQTFRPYPRAACTNRDPVNILSYAVRKLFEGRASFDVLYECSRPGEIIRSFASKRTLRRCGTNDRQIPLARS